MNPSPFYNVMRLAGLAGLALMALLPFEAAFAQAAGIPAFNVSEGDGGSTYSLSLQILALMTALTVLPSLVLGMTSFTRIIIAHRPALIERADRVFEMRDGQLLECQPRRLLEAAE